MVPAGGSVTVEVYGDKADSSMAIAEETKLTLPGLWEGLQDKIYGTAAAGSVVYQEKKKKVITQTELDAAVATAQAVLTAAAKDSLGDSYSQYDQRLFEVQPDSVSYDLNGEVGDEQEQLELKVKGQVAIVAFTAGAFEELAKKTVEASLDARQQLVSLQPQYFVYKLTKLDIQRAIAEVEVILAADTKFKPEAQLVDKEKLVNLSADEVAVYLRTLPQVASYEIKISPSFIRKMPSLVDRIKIDIKQ